MQLHAALEAAEAILDDVASDLRHLRPAGEDEVGICVGCQVAEAYSRRGTSRGAAQLGIPRQPKGSLVSLALSQ